VGQILRLYGQSQQERGNEAILLIEAVLHLNKSQANEADSIFKTNSSTLT
jgi:hypothetical protein